MLRRVLGPSAPRGPRGRRRGERRATLRDVPSEEAVRILPAYERSYGVLRPSLLRFVSALAGFDHRGTDEDRQRVVELMPMFALAPLR